MQTLFSDVNSDTTKNVSNRHSSYVPASEPLDVLSLLTPSAKSRFVKTSPNAAATDRPIPRRNSVTKVVYSIKTSDGTEVKSSEPAKRSVFGRSGIYGALEAALEQETKLEQTPVVRRERGMNSESQPSEWALFCH